MNARTVITHALTQGDRMRYTGTQSWRTDADTVTVVKPWGGLADPLYVVNPDGMDARFTYVVAASELCPLVSDAEWLAAPSVLASGVSLAKPGDAPAPAPVAPALDYAWLLKRNDLDGLADWFAVTTPSV